MSTERDEFAPAERLLQGLRQRGELEDLYRIVRAVYQTAKLKLDGMLLKRPLANSQDLAEVNYLQGQCEGVSQVLKRLEGASKLDTTRQPSARPNPA